MDMPIALARQPDGAASPPRRAASPLWRAVAARRPTTLALLGMAKNTGKTVALNHLLAQAAAAAVEVGVSSIGRDGERRDAVFATPKPPLVVWPGMLVATARGTLARARLRWKMLAATGIASPLGEILIVRAFDHGEMEVAGPARGSDQQKIITRLRQCGATLVILDGALGRSQHASPAIADGIVLATGAALGGSIGDVLRKTRERLALLALPAAPPELLGRCRELLAGGGVGVWDDAGRPLLRARIASLNAAATLLEFDSGKVSLIALGGAVGRTLWPTLLSLAGHRPGLAVVVADATRVFVERSELEAFRQRGGQLFAARPISVVGVTLNPCTPQGEGFDAAEFLAAARQALAGHEVCDVRLADSELADGAR